MIIHIEHEKTPGLTAELEHGRKFGEADLEDYFANYPDPGSYFSRYLSQSDGQEMRLRSACLPPGSHILDIGPGGGQSTIFLASSGFRVSVVEPSEDLSQIIHFAARKFSLDITIYICPAEYAENIPEKFDCVIFSSSFHHCDDPVRALSGCRKILNNDGVVFLLNEPILKFYRTKKWYFRKLETHPVQMGHYGGNEHIYRHGEYLSMLKLAGFRSVRSELNIGGADYTLAITRLRTMSIDNQKVYGPFRLFLRKIYYGTIALLHHMGPAGKFCLRLALNLSLIGATFIARK